MFIRVLSIAALLIGLLSFGVGRAHGAYSYSCPDSTSHSAQMWVTGYTPTGNRTATGVWPRRYRTVAVDPSVIPLGTWIYIEGLGWRHSEDTGGFSGYWLDVFVPTNAIAYAITGYYISCW